MIFFNIYILKNEKKNIKKKRTFRKKRGTNNRRLNKNINSTHKMKEGGPQLQQFLDNISNIFRRIRNQPPLPVIGVRISREIIPGHPISEDHFKKLEDRTAEAWEVRGNNVTPQQLYRADKEILKNRANELTRELYQYLITNTISPTTINKIERRYFNDINTALVKFWDHADLMKTLTDFHNAMVSGKRRASRDSSRDLSRASSSTSSSDSSRDWSRILGQRDSALLPLPPQLSTPPQLSPSLQLSPPPPLLPPSPSQPPPSAVPLSSPFARR